ncbi:FMN-dependent NADH-azoreductase [Brunnivagina elsteri]|uniref:FMN dependent NADH:quinone oxidoreductase n=1 Tax=Brunnivagina elsteri CCALA 953 TaxID=987040 RepID=A0A2A2TKJ8_9CYAN|nr:FMN-dependent NADH-azoreductase [Calothrix elsteri]PAX55200.1 FMN-dependent NADH-azoreductase [Calothrix elsteri CCALA 953]
MNQILHIDTSPRGERSHSRTLASDFVANWKNSYLDSTITYRDIGHQIIPPVSETWIAAAFSPPNTHTPELTAALQLSNELIDELQKCDRYIFSVPMYNFSIPANFKAYIDQVCRVGRTFAVNQKGGYEGLLTGKKMLVITARGGSFPAGTPAANFDFQEPYIRTVFGLMGVTDINFVNAENLAMKGDMREQSLQSAKAKLTALITEWD